MKESAESSEKSTKLRSLVKTVSWRIIATAITWVVVFLFTGEIGETTGITLTSAAVLMVGYYLHERVWDRFRFTSNSRS